MGWVVGWSLASTATVAAANDSKAARNRWRFPLMSSLLCWFGHPRSIHERGPGFYGRDRGRSSDNRNVRPINAPLHGPGPAIEVRARLYFL